MNFWNDRTVFLYSYSSLDAKTNSLRSDYLHHLRKLCDYQVIDSLEDSSELHQDGAVLLILVATISDLESLYQLKLPDSLVKVVAYFFSASEFQIVDQKSFRSPLKARLFRLIYPDQVNVDGIRYPSPEKTSDTIHARSIRNKFNLINLGNDITTRAHLDPSMSIDEIIQIGWYLRDENLNHSDSRAGAIAMRFGSGVLVNASNSDKYQITRDQVCYIENYNPETNTVYFVGKYPPSSESGVAYLIFQEFEFANLLVHFHCKAWTNSPKLNQYRTDRYVPYGTLEEAKTIIEKLHKTDTFVELNSHGEFIVGSDFPQIQGSIDRLQKLITSS